MTVTASAYFNGARFADGEFGFVAFSEGQFGEGSGLFPASFGATFVKQYDLNQGSLNADESIGSPTATFTASRGASNPATYIDSSGVIQLNTTSNTPRWTQGFYAQNGVYTAGRGLMIEGARSNLLKYGIFSLDAGSGVSTGWFYADDVTNTPTFTLIEEQFTNISNSKAQRWQHTLADGTYVNFINDTPAVASVVQDDVVTFSVWIKGTLSGSAFKMTIRERNAGGDYGSQHYGDDISASISATEWKRFTTTQTMVDADCSRVALYLRAEHSGSGSIDLQIAGAQVEQAPYASSFIPTTSAALTRNAEVLKYVISGNRTAAEESAFIKITPFFETASTDGFPLLTSTETKDRKIFLHTSGQYLYPNQTDSVDSFAKDTDDWNKNTSHVISGVMKHSSPYAEIYRDGISSNQDTVDDYTNPVWGTYFSLMCGSAGGSNVNGIIESVAFFNKAMSAAEVSRVTNILNK